MDQDVVENFYGVYLLYCLNPKFKGRTYIGYTTDPNRRIKQHNHGVRAGGALRTNNKGPWDMILIVHGFPNDISALRFEWAWTYPKKSRRLKDVPAKKSKESRLDFCLRVVAVMLQTNPWNRLPLTIRWLKQEYYQDFPPGLEPPVHMPLAFGAVKSTKVKPQKETESTERIEKDRCCKCRTLIDSNSAFRCLYPACSMRSHVTCLASHFLKGDTSNLIPIEGSCPTCRQPLLWGDLVRLKKGCYQRENKEDSDNHWADTLSQMT